MLLLLAAQLALLLSAALARSPVHPSKVAFFHGFINDTISSAAEWPVARSIDFQHVTLSGWRSNEVRGAAASFAKLTSDERQAILSDFHGAGKTLRVGAFGRGDVPVSGRLNAVDVAGALANFTLANALDGIDVNFEDAAGVADGSATGWLNSFQVVLQQRLGVDGGLRPALGDGTGAAGSGRPVPLLTYSPPAAFFAGAAGATFARFFRGKSRQISRLLVQFYGADAPYADADAVLGHGTEALPGRARIAALTQRDPDTVVVQKPLQENQPGHLAAAELGRAFCEADARVSGLSVWRIDYRDTAVSNAYLAGVRGYSCDDSGKPPSPPPNMCSGWKDEEEGEGESEEHGTGRGGQQPQQ